MLTRLLAVLVVAAVIACGFLGWRASAAGSRADAAESRAQALQGELAAAKAAHGRDDQSATATDQARSSAGERHVEQQARRERVEAIAHEPRPAVPDVCPDPDARIVRESEESTARIRAGEDRLRRY